MSQLCTVHLIDLSPDNPWSSLLRKRFEHQTKTAALYHRQLSNIPKNPTFIPLEFMSNIHSLQSIQFMTHYPVTINHFPTIVRTLPSSQRVASSEIHKKVLSFLCVNMPMDFSQFYKKGNSLLRKDREFMFKCAQEDGNVLRVAGKSLRNDKLFVLECVKRYGQSIRYASTELRNDWDVVSTAVEQWHNALEFASTELRSNVDLIRLAVKVNIHTLRYALDEIRNDPQLLREFISVDPMAIKYFNKELLRNNRDLVLAAIKKNGKVLRYAPVKDEEMEREVIWQISKVFSLGPLSLQQDRSLLLKLIQLPPLNWDSLLKYLPEHYQNIYEIVSTCLNINQNDLKLKQYTHRHFVDFPFPLDRDEDYILKVIKGNAHLFNYIYVGKTVQEDFVLRAIRVEPRVAYYMHTMQQRDLDFLWKAAIESAESLIHTTSYWVEDATFVKRVALEFGVVVPQKFFTWRELYELRMSKCYPELYIPDCIPLDSITFH